MKEKSRYEQVVGNAAARDPFKRRPLAILVIASASAIVLITLVLGSGAKGAGPAVVLSIAWLILGAGVLLVWHDAMVRVHWRLMRTTWSDGTRITVFFTAFLSVLALIFATALIVVVLIQKP